jgi:hypothetical protein
MFRGEGATQHCVILFTRPRCRLGWSVGENVRVSETMATMHSQDTRSVAEGREEGIVHRRGG